MDKDTLNKLYQMINHNLNGLKISSSPSFNAPLLTRLTDELIKNNNNLHEQYKTRFESSTNNNNKLYEEFKSSSFISQFELEEKINKCKNENSKNIYAIDEELLAAKREGISKYKDKENVHIKKIHFINLNKKENKETYIKEITNINNERIHAKQRYNELASDLSSINEQKQYKYNHSINASVNKNQKEKIEFEQYLNEKIQFLENLLEQEIEKSKKEITEEELIIADKTIMSNNAITKLSDDYKKRVHAQVKGYSSVAEMENGIEKTGDFSNNEKIYQGIKKTGKKMHDNEASFKKTGLQAREMPDKVFKREEMYESKDGFDMRQTIDHLKSFSDANKPSLKENIKLKTVFFKKTNFLNEEHMISRIPDEFKNEGEQFKMKDKKGTEYIVEWNNNKAHVLSYENKEKINETLDKFHKIINFESITKEKTTNDIRLNENKNINRMLKIMRNINKND